MTAAKPQGPAENGPPTDTDDDDATKGSGKSPRTPHGPEGPRGAGHSATPEARTPARPKGQGKPRRGTRTGAAGHDQPHGDGGPPGAEDLRKTAHSTTPEARTPSRPTAQDEPRRGAGSRPAGRSRGADGTTPQGAEQLPPARATTQPAPHLRTTTPAAGHLFPILQPTAPVPTHVPSIGHIAHLGPFAPRAGAAPLAATGGDTAHLGRLSGREGAPALPPASGDTTLTVWTAPGVSGPGPAALMAREAAKAPAATGAQRSTVVALRPGQPVAQPVPRTAPRRPSPPADPCGPPGKEGKGSPLRRAAAQPRHRAFRPRGGAVLMAADAAGGLAGALLVGAGVTATAVALAVLLAALCKGGLYRPGFAPAALAEVPAVAGRAALGWGAAAAVVTAMDVPALLGAIAATTVSGCLLRALVHAARRRAARRSPGSTLIVGAGPDVRQVAAALHDHPEYGMRPVGVVTPGLGAETPDPAAQRLTPAQAPDDPADLPLPELAGHAEITRAVIQNSVRSAVVVGPPTLDARTTATVRLLAAQGCCIWHAEEGGRGPHGPVSAAHLWGFSCRRLEVEPYPVPRPGRWAKRALDAGAAGLALLLLSPVLGVCALAVRIADGPGVLFRQERIGLGGRPFTLLKFRTLRPRDAGESATRWNVAGDHRMSAAGRLLRRTSLDELPQLWNVLRGDMSLVGPRPERPYFVKQFSTAYPGYEDRHRMPAGLTGLAQVHGLRGDTSIADRARFDNHYIDSWSLWQDVAIMLRTVRAVFRLGGS